MKSMVDYDCPHDITHHHTSIIYTIDNITMIVPMVWHDIPMIIIVGYWYYDNNTIDFLRGVS